MKKAKNKPEELVAKLERQAKKIALLEREAKVEAALERVRSKSLIMRSSDELGQVVQVVLNELNELNIENHGEATIFTYDDGSRDSICWLASDVDSPIIKFTMNNIDGQFDKSVWDQRDKGKKFVTDILRGQELKDYWNYLFTKTDFKYISQERKDWILQQDYYSRSIAFSNHSAVLIPTYSDAILDEEQGNILVRFSNVFNQAYTRFLDLQKAEAQAREAQIEAALERVRACTMAMQQSSELSEVSTMLFKELNAFCPQILASGVVLCDRQQPEQWMCSPKMKMLPPVHIPKDLDEVIYNLYHAWESAVELYSELIQGEALKSHNEALMTLPEIKAIYEHAPKEMYVPHSQTNYAATFKQGYLLVITEEPFSDDALFIRFAKVFEQTYTRFLDLQIAESQAREAQIEAALERVRSEGLAMHKTDQLQDVVNTVNAQLQALGLNLDGTLINIRKDNKEKTLNSWVNTKLSDARYSSLTYYEGKLHTNLMNWLGQGKGLLKEKHKTEDVVKWYKHIFKGQSRNRAAIKPQNKLLESIINYVRSSWACPLTMMTMIRFSGRDFTEDEHKILERFAKVFEQTYTRFLDIQKAEAQAREAQIEVGLERVRSVSLAMNNSNDLQNVIYIVFEQLKELGISMDVSFLQIFDDTKDTIIWVANPIHEHATKVHIPYFKNAILDRMVAARKSKENFISDQYSKRTKNAFYRKAFVNSELGKIPEAYKKEVLDKKGYSRSIALSKKVGLGVMNLDNKIYSDEINQLIVRFLKVFEQAYTRFLDLQKAETQARESQIEAALERVRAASMAMHKSEELPNVLSVMFKEFEYFNISDEVRDIEIFIIDESTGDATAWTSDQNFQNADTSYPFSFHVTPQVKKEYLKWKSTPFEKRKDLVINSFYEGATWEKVLKDFEKVEELKEVASIFRKEGIKEWATHHAYFSHGMIAIQQQSLLEQEDVDILQRFSTVFQQSYTRFQDIKKAEAQAREAQIEAAMERVRAQTMWMQQSHELRDVVSVMYKEMKSLGLAKWGCQIMLCHKEKEVFELWVVEETDANQQSNYIVKGKEHPVYRKIWENWENQTDSFTLHHRDEYKLAFDKYWLEETDFKHLPDEVKASVYNRNEVFLNFAPMKHGLLNAISFTRPSDNSLAILTRFSKVFEQTYTRFLDLKKAEAQAREAQIVAGLERVRSKTNAMHHSDELSVVINTLYRELRQLDVNLDRCILLIVEPESEDITWWVAGKEGLLSENGYLVQNNRYKSHRAYIDKWKQRKDKWNYHLKGREKKTWDTYAFNQTGLANLPDAVKNDMAEVKSVHLSISSADFGSLISGTISELTLEQHEIIKRMASVFNLTYTRFLDLQKAEAQTREAQIETALERVRSAAMAMHQSDDLPDVLNVIFEQMKAMDFGHYQSLIGIIDEEQNLLHYWAQALPGFDFPLQFDIGIIDHPYLNKSLQEWKSNIENSSFHLKGKEKKTWDKHIFSSPDLKVMPAEVKRTMAAMPDIYLSVSYMQNGILYANGPEPLSDENFIILNRFAKVLDLTYTRMLDLQKAEAQAREAQIEAALERVRTASMTMHKTEHLNIVCKCLFEELQTLNVKILVAYFSIINKQTETLELWLHGFEKEITEDYQFTTPFNANPQIRANMDAWLRGDEFIIYDFKDEAVFAWLDSLVQITGNEKFNIFKEFEFIQNIECSNQYGLFGMSTPHHCSDNDKQILKRFSHVFEQCFTRYLDIKKAEVQAQEAQIEAALERVRARAMSMHTSDELSEAAELLYKEFNRLEITPYSCGYVINDEEKGYWKVWMTDANDDSFKEFWTLPFDADHHLQERYCSWKSDDLFHEAILVGEENKMHHQRIAEFAPWKAKALDNLPDQLVLSCAHFDQGHLMIITGDSLSVEIKDVLIRFARVFEQTYTRFLDLKKAEVQAREAQIEAALERVRSRAMSMHSSDELAEVAHALFKELSDLNLDIYMTYFSLLEINDQFYELWLTKLGGELHSNKINLPRNQSPQIDELYRLWKSGIPIINYDAHKQDAKNYIDLLYQLSGDAMYKVDEYPESLYNLESSNKYGVVGIVTTDPASQEIELIVQKFSNVFEQTYTRFLDLKKAESLAVSIKEEKDQLEITLNNLKSTQTQLIQAEKMASLGELTAGIAHEIQNPLNFVNNFSDVSGELIDEALEEFTSTSLSELTKDNIEEVKDILNDLKQNLEKISHHGGRASSIVKGMLDHSRAGSDEKTLTDINALCDEYLRLSYHGLRAKDKSFNADFETHFDENTPLINVVSQDIGRVLLNIFNNAFFAVNEKANAQPLTPEGNPAQDVTFKPVVTITTRSAAIPPSGGQGASEAIEVKITDNGIGMSPETIDKVFQPFFTTKPTGQGTGLGMSISYDIITKGHGGELKVESVEGEGTKFIIKLPTS